MPGPRKLWKTTIVVWSEFNPNRVETVSLVREAVDGQAIITKQESELVSDPYSQEDGPPEEFFETICEGAPSLGNDTDG
jgi:hypothetical protein